MGVFKSKEEKIKMKSLNRIKLLAAAGLVIVLVLAGCAAPTPTPTPTPVPTGPSGELKVAITSFGEETFDPITTGQTAVSSIVAPMNDTLTAVKGNDLTPRVLDKWELATDGGSWVFYVHKGITWHDGAPVTAKDVKFSLERYSSNVSFMPYLKNALTGKVDLVDDYTVRAFTKGPQPYVPWIVSVAMAGQGYFVPKDYFEKNGKDYYNQNPVGNGPYKFVSHVKGDSIKYEAVANHWRIVPEFKTLTIMLVPEETTRLAMLKTGGLDIIDVGIEGALEADKAGLKSAALSTNSDVLQLFGTHGSEKDKIPTGNLKVRQALSLAINRDEIRQTVMYGKAGPPSPPWFNYTTADIDADYWRTYTAQAYRYDPAEAKKLLAEAGFANGFTIKLYSFTQGGAPYLPKLGEIVQGYWSKIGVKTEIVPIDWGTLYGKMISGGPNKEPVPDLVGNGAISSWSQAAIAGLKYQAAAQSKQHWNLFSTAKPELDALIAQSVSELDTAKRKDAIAKAAKIVVDAYVGIGITNTPAMAAIGPKVDIQFPPGTLAIPVYLDLAKHKK